MLIRLFSFIFPGKKPFSRNTIALAQERRPKIEEYLKNLVVIPALQNSAQVQAFFYRRSGDPKDDDPIVWGAIKELSGGTESPFLSSENQRIVSRLKLSSDGMYYLIVCSKLSPFTESRLNYLFNDPDGRVSWFVPESAEGARENSPMLLIGRQNIIQQARRDTTKFACLRS